MPSWLQTIIDIVTRLLGGQTSADRAQVDRRLGQIQQQLEDTKESAREARGAAEISKQVDQSGVAAAADDLDSGVQPHDPSRQ